MVPRRTSPRVAAELLRQVVDLGARGVALEASDPALEEARERKGKVKIVEFQVC